MKFRLFIWISFILISLTGQQLMAQNKTGFDAGYDIQKTLKNSMITVRAEGYRGTLQWQKSVNGSDWLDVIGMTEDFLTQTITDDIYFRVGVKDNLCDLFYSGSIKYIPVEPVVVSTYPVTAIGYNQALASGEIVNPGNDTIQLAGICYGMVQSPDTTGPHISFSNITGRFEYLLTDLHPDKNYFIRAFAVNFAGISYGPQTAFTTLVGLAQSFTDSVTLVTDHSAMIHCSFDLIGGGSVIQSGFCWSQDQNPDMNDFFTTIEPDTTHYNGSITGLLPNVTYYVRAFLRNEAGIAYGQLLSFNTLINAPLVETTAVSNITSNSVQCFGEVIDTGGGNVDLRGFCWSTDPAPDTTDAKITGGSGPGEFNLPASPLLNYTTYFFRAFAMNEKGIVYGQEISITTLPSLPVISTKSASGITAVTAQSGGDIWNNGGAPVASKGICWSLSPAPKTTDFQQLSLIDSDSYTLSISDLSPNTKYYVRAFASNGAGLTYGNEVSFTTIPLPPTLTTTSVSAIAQTTASAGGNITSDGNASITARGVCWSVSAIPTIANTKTTDGTGTGSFTSSLSGLTGNTTYYVRAYATNIAATSYGNEVSFKTSPVQPVLTTSTITAITQSSAVSGGNVSDDGGASVTARGICWSTSAGPTTAGNKTVDGTGTGAFTSNITGLTANTLYFVRSYAINSVGTSYGSEVSFTASQGPPMLSTTAISSITQTTAASGGSITNDGGASVTAKGVCWSTDPSPTIASSKTFDGTGPAAYTSTIVGLTGNTTYYVRAFATNSLGTGYGNQVSFLTSPVVPSLSTTAITSLTQTTAVSGGNISGDGGASVSARGVCWSTASNPTLSDSKTTNGTGTGVFSSNLTGMSANTSYHVRAYATNSAGTGYGNDIIFLTSPSLPALTTTAVSALTAISASSGGNITNDGGASVTARGVCWSTSQTPTTANSKSSDGTGTGAFTSSLTGLTANTTYYLRAYATNTMGTGYGNQITIVTDDNGAYLTTPLLSSSLRSSFKGWRGIFANVTFSGTGGATNGYSGITFDWDRNVLYIIGSNAHCIWVVNAPGYGVWTDATRTSQDIRIITLVGDAADCESITYLGNNWIMIGDEQLRKVRFFQISSSTTSIDVFNSMLLDNTELFALSEAQDILSGLEGLAYDFYNKKIYALCQVGSSGNRPRLFMWDWDFATRKILAGTRVELTNTFQGFATDFPQGANDLYYSPLLRRLFVIDGKDGLIGEYNCLTPGTADFGKKIGALMNAPVSHVDGNSLGNGEGICLSPDGRYMYLVFDNNGNDAFAYAPVPLIRSAQNNGLSPDLYPFPLIGK